MKWLNITLSVVFVCFGAMSANANESKLVAKGRLHSIVDNIVLLATPIKKSESVQLQRAGFIEVSKKTDIAPGTIYKKNLYVGYTMVLADKSLKSIKAKVGRKVQLILRRTKSEKPVVVQVK